MKYRDFESFVGFLSINNIELDKETLQRIISFDTCTGPMKATILEIMKDDNINNKKRVLNVLLKENDFSYHFMIERMVKAGLFNDEIDEKWEVVSIVLNEQNNTKRGNLLTCVLTATTNLEILKFIAGQKNIEFQRRMVGTQRLVVNPQLIQIFDGCVNDVQKSQKLFEFEEKTLETVKQQLQDKTSSYLDNPTKNALRELNQYYKKVNPLITGRSTIDRTPELILEEEVEILPNMEKAMVFKHDY